MEIALSPQQIHLQLGRSNSPVVRADSSIDFDAILAAVRRGETPTPAECDAWGRRKGFTRLEDGPDEVEKAGMMRGFKMEFPDGFPGDLRQKLEAMYNDPQVDRWAFVNTYSTTFHPLLSGQPWDNNWRERLKDTYEANARFTDTISNPLNHKYASDMDRLLKSLLS